MSSNYNKEFIETIQESVDIEGHLTFVTKLLEKFLFKEEKRNEIINCINLIREKKNDPQLYLAIVGEFSSGKSTFINSLIRDDLLKIDVLPATTAASTIIEYGDVLDAIITYNNGTIKIYRKEFSILKKIGMFFKKENSSKEKNDIRDYIQKITTNEEVAKNIKNVKIHHTSEMLKNGLVIIDTPGTNVENERHEIVTKNAIKDISDAAIIIIPSNKPISQSMIDFINDNLKDIISRCIFVVTKLDLLREKERKRVIDYIEKRLSLEFNVTNINVLGNSPLLTLNDALKADIYELNISDDDKNKLLEQSYDTEKKIYEILKEQRILIQLQKLIILIKTLFNNIENELKISEKIYSEKHSALEKNKISNLSGFIKKQKKKHTDVIYDEASLKKMDLLNLINSIKLQLLETIKNKIDNTTSERELNKFFKKELDVIFKSSQSEVQNKIKSMNTILEPIGRKNISIFEIEFKKLYNSLATLGGTIKINEQKIEKSTSMLVTQSINKNATGIKEIKDSEDAKVGLASLGGAGAGAAIGTILLPGVGTVIGAAFGLFAGALFKKPLDEQKKEYLNNITSSIDKSFDNIIQSVEQLYEEAINDVIRDMNIIIDNYFKQYDKLVKSMILRDEEEKKELLKKRQNIKTDLNELSNRQKILENMERNLQ